MSRLAMSGRRGAVTALALVALVAGVILVVVAVRAQQSAPRPPRSVGTIDSSPPAHRPDSAPGTSTSSTRMPSAEPADTGSKPLGPSRPVRIRIPAIGVSSVVDALGLAKDGTLAVPQPGPLLDQAAWFDRSPAPGQPGPAIIEGHVDSEQGASVFFRLGAVRPGNRIYVAREDGVGVVFRVDAVRDYPKRRFPTTVVYGGNLHRPQLRLITCSDFNPTIHHHTGDEVVFSHLVAVHHHTKGSGTAP